MEIKSCNLCPRRCGAFRQAELGNGFCKMGANAAAARAALHFWEEPCISGQRGSGAIFFTGCSLKCVYCQNYEISTERRTGKYLTPEELADIFQRLADQGAHNINLVNPTHFSAAIIRALEIWKPYSKIPVVYNTGGYECVEVIRALKGLVDVYLPDFKYADDQIAQRYSGVQNYVSVTKNALLAMAEQTGPVLFDEDGMIQRGTIVRHLILPGHTRNSFAVLDWLAENLRDQIWVSLMAQYVPCGRAEEYPELNRRITRREYEKVEGHLFELGLDGFVQERAASKKDYIPDFNLEGIFP